MGPPGRPAVLICAPWGWEETASYRGRRAWGHRLAAAGHPTLRFDLPSVGDSSGGPGDPGLVEAWIAAVADAAAWLRVESGRGRVCAIGLGLGGTLAMAALDAGAAIDELVLWAVPARGARLVREIETFGKMQAWGTGRGEETPLPPGWIEAGGFVLSAETVAALKALDPLQTVPPRLRRALLLDRDGLAIPAALTERLEAAGTAVTIGSGAGWGKMVFHPEHAIFPAASIDAANLWLGAVEGTPAETPAPEHVTATERLSFAVEGADAGTEWAFMVPRPSGNAFAVVSEPEGDPVAPDLCVVFLNSGAIRHSGPNRNWVEDARRWTARGLRCVRVDLDAIGEADGERPQDLGVAGFYSEEYEGAVRAVLDAIAERGLGDRVVCIGLCSGAYWSMHMADRDPRVETAVLLNPGALIWHTGLSARREMQWVSGSMLQGSSWKKLLRFEVNLLDKARIVRKAVIWRLKRGYHWLGGLLGGSGPPRYESELEELFDRLREADRRVAMSFSVNEPVLAELREDGLLDRMERWPNIEVGSLAGEDHALGPIPAQHSGWALVDRELERVLALERGPDLERGRDQVAEAPQ